jgi:hypoxanthine phosphoribosyltransferase
MNWAISFFLGIISSIIASILIHEYQIRKRVSWKEILDDINRSLVKINSQDINFDIVLGIGRSGTIIGSVIAGNLGSVPLLSLPIVRSKKKITNTGNYTKYLTFPYALPKQLFSNKKVLVVFYVNSSGATLHEVMSFVSTQYYTSNCEFRTFTLYESFTSSIKAEFIGKIVDNNRIQIITDKKPWILNSKYRNIQNELNNIRF